MATLNTVLGYARAQAQTDSNGLTNANGIIFANEALLDFHRQMISEGVDASQLQEAYRDANTNTPNTYLYPTDMFFLKAIELNYTDTSSGNYKTAQQVDISNLPGNSNNSFSWLRTNASTNQPLFDDRGDWFEVFPGFSGNDNLSQAIRIVYFLKPTEYVATSDTIGYPESLDYRVLAWRIAANYYYSLNKFNEGSAFEQKYQEHVRQLLNTLKKGTQQPTTSTPIQDAGWNY